MSTPTLFLAGLPSPRKRTTAHSNLTRSRSSTAPAAFSFLSFSISWPCSFSSQSRPTICAFGTRDAWMDEVDLENLGWASLDDAGLQGELKNAR